MNAEETGAFLITQAALMDGVQNLKSRLGSDMFTIIVLELKE
jgi:hypothetical protein